MAARHFHGHGHLHAHRHRAVAEDTVPLDLSDMVNHIPAGQVETGQIEIPSLMGRSDESQDNTPSTDTNTIAIALGVVIPLVLALGAIYYFHRRSVQRQRREDMMDEDKYKSMDFGDAMIGGPTKTKRRSNFFGGGKEKDPNHRPQLSMDMNLSSPYLLPPTLHPSRESLAKSLNKADDPYRIVEYAGSDVTSLRSLPKAVDRGSSVYTGRTRSSFDHRPPPRQNSNGSSPLNQTPPPPAKITEEELPPVIPAKNEFRFVDEDDAKPEVPPAEFPATPTIQEPPMAATRDSYKSPSVTLRPTSEENQQPHLAELANERDPAPVSQSLRESQQSAQGLGVIGATPHPGSVPVIEAAEFMDQGETYPQEAIIEHLAVDDTRQSQMMPHSAGLAIPQQDNKRLSVGFRPLPPNEMLESEDPEFRANRIRSFYKEYFEDYTRQDSGQPPPMPHGEYYEDYDQNYLGEAAYFDPETNAFVMPYAQPVTRRAMTPPPNSRRPMPGPKQRGPGPRGPPGMGMPQGPGGRARAGSTMSASRWGHPMSPRPGSSASNPRFGGKPRKPLPPPAALSTLPTPSKLKDDSFAIFNATDFAPPPTFKDHVAGRSQSPLGERKAYALNTPIHSPMVSTFEETAALPSPHMLRKSGTFTSLDFAPPRRFKDPDSMSDAGSIRSNNSGISSKNAFAIRNGAGRISRLPEDMVFNPGASATTLKPQWGMRP